MTGLAIDDAAWASAWRVRSPAQKLLLSAGLLVCALTLPAWPGAVLVTGAAAVLTRSWDRARRMQEGLTGRGMETGLRVLPDDRSSSPAFRALALGLPAGIAALALVSR